MSFGGGGSAQYRIDYIIKVASEGNVTGINQVKTATDGIATSSMSAEAAQNKLATAQNKVQQAGLGVSKATKGMAFGILGITTAGAEAVGMFSMWQQTQVGVKEAQQGVNDAIAEFGEGSHEAKQASQELAKANRWAAMTNRNLMLSMFDLVPFVVLTINGMMKLKTALAARAAATKELAALNLTLGRSEVGLAAATKASGASMLLNANGMQVASKAGLGFRGTLAAISTAATGLLIKLAPLLAIFAAIGLATAAYANNWLGLRSTFDSVGVSIGNLIPQLRGVLTTMGEVADKIGKGDFQGAIDVLMQKVTGETRLENISKRDEEAEKKLQEIYARVRESQLEFVKDLAHQDDEEQEKSLFNLGIKGGAGTRFEKTLDNYEKFTDTITNFGNAWKTANMAMELKSMGFKVPDSMFKKIEFTFADRFEAIDKMIKGPKGDIFGNLAKELEKDAKAGGGNFNQIMLKYIKGPQGQEMMKIAEQLGMTEFTETVTKMLDDEEKKIMDAARQFGTKVSKWYKNIPKNPNPVNKAEFTLDQIEKLPDDFVSQFPSTLGKVKQLPPVSQDVKINITDTAGNAYKATGGSLTGAGAGALGAIIYNALTPLFNAGAWQRAITTLGSPSFWGGLAVDIDRFISSSLGTMPLSSGDGSGGMNMGQGVGFSKWLTYIQGAIAPFFNVGNWQRAIVLAGSPSFWGGLAVDIDRFVSSSLGTMPLSTGDGSGGMNAGQGVGFSNWIKYITDSVAPLFHAGHWQSAILTAANPAFWAGLTADINKVVQDNLSRLEATKNEPNSGGMDVGQGGIGKWIQDTLAPIFDINNWKTFVDKLAAVFNPQLAEAIQGSILPKIEPEFDFMNDQPKAHAGMEFKNGKWQKQKKSGQGPRGQDMLTIPAQAEITKVSGLWVGPGDYGTADIPTAESATEDPGYVPPVPVAAQIVNIIVPATLGQQTVETTTAIFNLWKSLVTNVNTMWNALMVGMANVEASFIVNTSSAMQQMHDYIATNVFNALAIHWSNIGIGLIATATSVATVIQETLNQALENIAGIMNNFASHWSTIANSLINNGESAADGITEAIADAMDDGESRMSDLASHWSSMCNSLINNAESAADGINDALDSIEDEEVIIHYKTTGSKSPGRQAHGTDQWVHKPTLFMAGEQGSERITVTRAHSKPGMHEDDGGSGGTGTTIFNGTVNLRINGSEIINDTRLQRKIKMTVGENRDRFGA